MPGSSQETLPAIWYWSGDPSEGPEVFGDHPGGVELVGRLSRRSGCSQRPSQRCGTGRETLPEVRNWSRNLFGGPKLIDRPSRRSESGREIL